jgi:signal transduction histidine kinase/CheY-like chemotaxis protein
MDPELQLDKKEQRDNVKILVVDDEEVMLKLVSNILSDEGYQVSSYSSSLRALEKINEEEFDLMIADIKMPDLDGIELVKKAHQVQPDVGALFMTGYASVDTAKEALKEGAYDYILKPFELSEVRKAVAFALEKRREQLGKVKTGDLAWLYDLNRVLSSTIDRKVLLKLLLGLALTHCQLKYGSIFIWDQPDQEAEVLISRDLLKGIFEEKKIKVLKENLDEWGKLSNNINVDALSLHPVFGSLCAGDEESSVIIRNLLPAGKKIVSIPIGKGGKTVGFLNLIQGEEKLPEDNDLKLLSIVATQTAISLENLRLLESAQTSYAKLKKLQEQLVELERMTAEAQRSAEIGHDLNNFMMIIRGNLELLTLGIKQKDFSRVEKCVNAINEHLSNAEIFVKGLMDFSSLKTEKTLANIPEIIERVLTFVEPQRRFKNIIFKKFFHLQTPPISVDASQIQQILYNILNNAADATLSKTPQGGVITIGVHFLEDSNFIEIFISDSGTGISAENLKKIFKSRFTSKEHGHGFGLLACKRIVENHNGTVEIESQEGIGTTFKIKLPCLSKASNSNNQS